MLPDNFNELVYDVVETIPEGKVVTYGQIALALGFPRNARAVGAALKAAPISRNLPCHRVIGKNGKLAPSYAFDGRENQQAILMSEGVIFKSSGSIDMPKSLWTYL